MTPRAQQFDSIAIGVLLAAMVSWLLGSGWWSPALGVLLIGFGPGYLLLHGASRTVRSRLVRAGLYLASSLAIATLIGFGIAASGYALSYGTIASAHLLVVIVLFLTHELERGGYAIGSQKNDLKRRYQLIRPRVVVAVLPLVGVLVLLATSPVRSPPTTQLHFGSIDETVGDQLRNLPSTYSRVRPLELRVVAQFGSPATDEIIDLLVDDRLVESLAPQPGSTIFDRVVTVDTSNLLASTARIEARLSAPGRPQLVVWLNLAQEPVK